MHNCDITWRFHLFDLFYLFLLLLFSITGTRCPMEHPQHWLCGRVPRVLWIWCCHDGGGLYVKESSLYSDTHDSDYRKSSKVIPVSGIETPQTAQMCNLGLQTLIHNLVHKEALPPTGNPTSLLYSLAPTNQQTNGVYQPGTWPISMPLCQQAIGWLAWPTANGRVLAQQSYTCFHSVDSILAWHQIDLLYGLWT